MKKRYLPLLAFILLGCDSIWGSSALDGDWYIQDTYITFRIYSQGDKFAVSFPHEEQGAKGSLDGTLTYPKTLKLVIPYHIAPQVYATASYIADYSAADKTFRGTFNYETNSSGGNRQGDFRAIKF
jgi:hypothetical protein